MRLVASKHAEAMELAEAALAARSSGDARSARALSERAFVLERDAARLVASHLDLEPTRSVLHRSAATLALDAGYPAEAERLVHEALAGQPPVEVADELRGLLAQIAFEQREAHEGERASSPQELTGSNADG